MPNFAGSKMQRVNKYAGLHAPQTHPPGLQPGLHCKTTLCFSASTCRQDGHTRHPRQPANSFPVAAGQHLSGLILYRAPPFPVVYYFSPGASRQQPFAAYLFIPALTASRQPVTSFRLDRPVRFRSHVFFLFLPFHSIQKRKPAKPISLSFSYNFKSSPNLIQAFPSRFP